ncbi:alpha-glucuronidase [bacterium]|nr:alpha-glucuronidase [bacterium]
MQFSRIVVVILMIGFFCECERFSHGQADDGYELWMKYGTIQDTAVLDSYSAEIRAAAVTGQSPTCSIIRDELHRGLAGLLGKVVEVSDSVTGQTDVIVACCSCKALGGLVDKTRLETLGEEGYLIQRIEKAGRRMIVVTANEEMGLLYGTFGLLRFLQTGKNLNNLNLISRPRIHYRLLNHWDNLDGTVERGYAGKSLWKWKELPEKKDSRYTDYARANASIGINGTVLNNVNANPVILKPEYIEKVSVLADIFRPYGIRVFLSINFSSPVSADFEINGNRRAGIGDLPTSDPMDPRVRAWWKNKTREIYDRIPDFGGFLVKANSEGMPGPQDYDRSHAEGANMLAEALAPYGGLVMWRAFVYNAEVDADRAKRAYCEFVPLDGQFEPNVFVQSKNGPVDFQPREPIQPLFGAMPQTPLMLELQITQEYLGHSKHLVYLAPMWKEYLEFDTYAGGKGSSLARIVDGTVLPYTMTGIAGVSNIGNDRNWTGHFFAQANWFAFGRLAWDHTLTSEAIADDWIRMSLTWQENTVAEIRNMMLHSREACVNYMTPLGLHHIMQADFHYGPQPGYSDAPRRDWTSVYYHRADSVGIGFDRSSAGSGAVKQYFSPWRELFDSPETCPEKYLLWFHHVPWDFTMRSGHTLWEEICSHYFAGTDTVDSMVDTWTALEGQVNPAVFRHVAGRLSIQQKDAAIWRDSCLNYFQGFSNKAIYHEYSP